MLIQSVTYRQPVIGEKANPPCLWMAANWRCSPDCTLSSQLDFPTTNMTILDGNPCDPPALTVQAGAGTCWYLLVARTIHGLYSGTPLDIPLGLKGPGRRRPCPWQWFHKTGHILVWNAWEMEQTDTYSLNFTFFRVQLRVMNWQASSDLAWIW